MNSAYPVDIAARAASLSQRIDIVSALTGPADAAERTRPLSAFDAWHIDRLAASLANRFAKESLRTAGSPRYTAEALAETLSAYRRHELGLSRPDSRLGELLADLQRDWLPTYQAALDGFDPASGAATEASWRVPDVYYGRFATACEPFLLELGHRLTDADPASVVRVDPRVIDEFQIHLLSRFELPLAWAVETDAKVHCGLRGIDPARATREDYLAYLDKTFADAASYHRFYLEFPILGRWLADVTGLVAEYGRELIARLRADAGELAEAFFTEPITALRSVRLGCSDVHAGAKTVAFLEVELASGATASVVYKPRCVNGEAALQGVLGRLRDDGILGFARRAVLSRAGYGYEALIPSGRNRVNGREEAANIYAELGGYLAIFYVLGGGDLHFENVLVADGHAFICDCETVLGALPKGQPRPADTLMDSIFKTGLVEWPRGAAVSDAELRLSGYSGGGAYEMPMPVPQINDLRMTFRASVTHREGVRVEPGAANRVFIGDRLTHVEDFVDAIRSGFDRVYRWFQERPDRATGCVREYFTGSRVRFINRSTQVYAQLLLAARHPKCLIEPLEVDLLFHTVRTFPRLWDSGGALSERELASMWRLDVPLFTVDADGDELVHDHRSAVPTTLETAPLELAAARIRRLSAHNRAQQDQYITAALSGGEVTSPEFADTCIEQASGLGMRLCRMMRGPEAPAPWTSYLLGETGKTEVDIEGDLYNGSAGIALFLAYLDALDPRPEFRRAARRAIEHALAGVSPERIGAFSGLGGLIYVLTHLYRLWNDRALLGRADALVDELAGRVERDRHLDVFHGVAGLIPVLLGLGQVTDGRGIDIAERCAAHLLRHAEADGDTLSWPNHDPGTVRANLTGLSHGAGGIGWALIALGRHVGRPDYIDAGRRSFAYETRHFDEAEQDWYDLRKFGGGPVWRGRHYANAWCNGAAGIGLTRTHSWALLGKEDDTLLTQARQALTATMRNFPRLNNDTLCHGRCGNAEFFVRFATLADEPAFRLEANVQVQNQWRDLDDAHPGRESGFFPGLMLGMAGFGMHFLRLARPEHIPSVLLLDPPPSTIN